jgi:hypothetical protein
MSRQFELLVTEGPLKGRRFAVPDGGLRLGRSSTCEISIPDPALSRTHCLAEVRDDGLWVTDLASANGTFVNGEQLGPESRCLQSGDRLAAGDSELQVVASGSAAQAPAPAAETPLPVIDLGLGGDGQQPAEKVSARSAGRRFLLWGVAIVCVIAAAAAMLLMPVGTESESGGPELHAVESDRLVSFTFEKVKADARAVYRYALSYDGQSLHVAIDDVPESNRHVKKSVELKPDARARLGEILAAPELYRLAPEYTGNPLESGSLLSFSLHVIRSAHVFDVTIENKSEPDAFREMRGRLEAFAKSELGIWAIQSSVAELVALSADARRVADAKWAERESRFGNYAEALRKYDEALQYLETVDPKPADYEEIRTRRATVAEELEQVYVHHRGNADHAIGTQNWEQARYELHVLFELVPDTADERHQEASRKLLEVEAGMKKRR